MNIPVNYEHNNHKWYNKLSIECLIVVFGWLLRKLWLEEDRWKIIWFDNSVDAAAIEEEVRYYN